MTRTEEVHAHITELRQYYDVLVTRSRNGVAEEVPIGLDDALAQELAAYGQMTPEQVRAALAGGATVPSTSGYAYQRYEAD